ncbi:MAG TPA: hypothetical protein VJW20_09360 [Candidatus Angelobacter sp.]|nr:hypothetical protein [Candidatus Angelobacter sp.]
MDSGGATDRRETSWVGPQLSSLTDVCQFISGHILEREMVADAECFAIDKKAS